MLAGGEHYDGVTAKTAKVVEAATPSGACVVRVKAHALPNRTAALLDEHAHVLSDLISHHGRKQQAATQQFRPLDGIGQRRSIDGGNASRELQMFREGFASSLDTAGSKQLMRLLERSWLLGPRNVGPNIALCSPEARQNGTSCSSSLFEVPAAAVVKVTSKHGPLARIAGVHTGAHHHHESTVANGTPADAGVAAANGVSSSAADTPEQRHVVVVFGRPTAAAALRQNAGEAAICAASDSAVKAAACAAELAAAAGVGVLWPHITSSVESGVTSGFQLAAGAGPLCDEAMWGVLFEIEVRIVVPGAGAELDLAEAVYGPFSGQVGMWAVLKTPAAQQ